MHDVFASIRKQIIGHDATITTPYHASIPMVYADWTASGRMYAPIEERFTNEIYPLVANTHTETNTTGKAMTCAYHDALRYIKQHVGANEEDVILCEGTGMTGAVNKFQRILGLKIHESLREKIQLEEENTPIVFVTHMEHHSNHISWSETMADVEIIPADANGLPDLVALESLLNKYSQRKLKIAAVTGASNVTGIQTPYSDIARIVHEREGYCFVDFACSAPYVSINMHPENPAERLDAIFFSPHKFLGGPGSSGVAVFSKSLYKNTIPDNPGGGTVTWTSPYDSPKYIRNIEEREDGGTPGFLQVMRVAMAVRLKEQMSVERILLREKEQVALIIREFEKINGLQLLESRHSERLGVFSFRIDNCFSSLGVRILNDRFGIQVRGGCSCAGTYGHYLYNIDEEQSCGLYNRLESGDIYAKPGWIRMSIHPTMPNEELLFICDAIRQLAEHYENWAKDYIVHPTTGEITCLIGKETEALTDPFRPFHLNVEGNVQSASNVFQKSL